MPDLLIMRLHKSTHIYIIGVRELFTNAYGTTRSLDFDALRFFRERSPVPVLESSITTSDIWIFQ